MPKKIIDKVREKRDEIEADPFKAEENANLAIAALLTGINSPDGTTSPEWRAYMWQFVEDPESPLGVQQLGRLLAPANALDDDLNRKRAYMVGNAICGAASPGQTMGGGGFMPNPMNSPLFNAAVVPAGGGAMPEGAVEAAPGNGSAVRTAAAAVPEAAPAAAESVQRRRLDFLVDTIDLGLPEIDSGLPDGE